MNTEYYRNEWDNALEAAEGADWDPIDAGEQSGPLAQWICDEVIDHVNVGRDDRRIEAAFNLLTGRGEEPFSADRLITVLGSWRGETVDDWQILAKEYAETDYTGEDNPADTNWKGFRFMDDYRRWFLNNGVTDGEAHIGSTPGMLYWFDLNGL